MSLDPTDYDKNKLNLMEGQLDKRKRKLKQI